jgi:hypothetical protein
MVNERIVQTFIRATGRAGTDDEINWPPEKQPTHDDEDLIACYLAAWVDYLASLLDCPQPITQACVDEKYAEYEIAVVTCETLYPPPS